MSARALRTRARLLLLAALCAAWPGIITGQGLPRGGLDLAGRFRTLVYQALIPP